MGDTDTNRPSARSLIVKHWQILVAAVGIVWVGGADAQQIKTTQANVTQAQTDIATAREQYAALRGEIGKVEGELSVLIAQRADTGTQP